MAFRLLILLLLLPLPVAAASVGWLGKIRLWHDNVEVEGNQHPLAAERWWYGGETGYALQVTGAGWRMYGGALLRAEAGGAYNVHPFVLSTFRSGRMQFELGTTIPSGFKPALVDPTVATEETWLARVQGRTPWFVGLLEVARLQAPADLQSEIFYLNGYAALGTGRTWPVWWRGGLHLYHRAGQDTGGTGWRRPLEPAGQMGVLWSDLTAAWRIASITFRGSSGVARSFGGFGADRRTGTAVTAATSWQWAADAWRVQTGLTGRFLFDRYQPPLGEAWLADDGLATNRTRRQLEGQLIFAYQWPSGPTLFARVRQAVVWRQKPAWFNESELGLVWWFGGRL